MTLSTRLLLAASLCLAPLTWAAAQDQQSEEQHRRERQEQQHPQQPQRGPQQPQVNQQQQHVAPPQGNIAPPGKGAGVPSGAQQFQHPPQTDAAPPNAQTFQRPPQTNIAPPGPPPSTTASPVPAPGQNQFRRVQGPPQNGSPPPTGSVQQQQFQHVQGPLQNGSPPPTGSVQQQQFQQRSFQRGGAPNGSAGPGPQQQQTTTFRGNFQGTRNPNPAVFAERHSGAAPTQFRRGLFYGRDYAHFTPRESALWRSGAWRRESHAGRFGWWFVADGVWYFYDQPIYPYPTFIPEVVYIPDEDYGYDEEVSDDAPASLPNGVFYANGMYYYYYCPALQTYYPYVGTCPSAWQAVPATPQ